MALQVREMTFALDAEIADTPEGPCYVPVAPVGGLSAHAFPADDLVLPVVVVLAGVEGEDRQFSTELTVVDGSGFSCGPLVQDNHMFLSEEAEGVESTGARTESGGGQAEAGGQAPADRLQDGQAVLRTWLTRLSFPAPGRYSVRLSVNGHVERVDPLDVTLLYAAAAGAPPP